MISRTEALVLVDEPMSLGRSKDTWYMYYNHVFGVAKGAEAVAKLVSGMDSERAYIMGLLHDIGYERDEKARKFHGLVGYEMLKDKDEEAALVCLTHTFPWNEVDDYEEIKWRFFDNKKDYDLVKKFVSSKPLTDYDLLIQLMDCLFNKDGFVTLEQRQKEYVERRKVAVSKEHIQVRAKLKEYFDKKIGLSIYEVLSQL